MALPIPAACCAGHEHRQKETRFRASREVSHGSNFLLLLCIRFGVFGLKDDDVAAMYLESIDTGSSCDATICDAPQITFKKKKTNRPPCSTVSCNEFYTPARARKILSHEPAGLKLGMEKELPRMTKVKRASAKSGKSRSFPLE